jgi:zinc protease
VTFDPGEVEKERGVVLEEWRLGRGASMRLFDKQAPVLFFGSKYAERITIGKPDIIKNAPRDALVRFYKDWYRPDLMAVIAVGDFVPDEMEAKIKQEFSSVKPSASPRPRPAVPVPAHERELVSIETDPEATSTSVSITTKLPHRPLATATDYRRIIGERLFNSMLNARLDEIRRQPNAPFLGAGSRSGGFVRTADAFTLAAGVKEGQVQEGFGALLEETLRVERHGFVPSELARAKSDVLRAFQQAVKQRDTEEGRQFAREIVRLFLTQEAMPGPEAELALVTRFLPTYTLEELNGLAKSLAVGSHVVTVTGPATMIRPTEDGLLATMKDVQARDIKPYDDAAPTVPLMAETPAPGPVVSTRTIPELGVTEWTLKNGVRVVVKPTDFKNDEVRMTAFAPGGTSLAPDADYESAKYAHAVVARGASDRSTRRRCARRSRGRSSRARAPTSASSRRGLRRARRRAISSRCSSSCTSRSPRRAATRTPFVVARARAREREEPAALSGDRPSTTTSSGLLDDEPPASPADDARGDPEGRPSTRRSPSTRAASPTRPGFTFVFVGNLDLARTKTLAETYLGSLPATNKGDVEGRPRQRPRGVAKKAVAKGSEPKSSVSLTFHGREKWSPRRRQRHAHARRGALASALREVLREDMGGRLRRDRVGRHREAPEGALHVHRQLRVRAGEHRQAREGRVGRDQGDPGERDRRRLHRQGEGAPPPRARDQPEENGYWLRELERAYTYGDDPEAHSRLRRDGRQGDLGPRAEGGEEVPREHAVHARGAAAGEREWGCPEALTALGSRARAHSPRDRIPSVEVCKRHVDDPVRVEGVLLFDQRALVLEASHRVLREVHPFVTERGVEREA